MAAVPGCGHLADAAPEVRPVVDGMAGRHACCVAPEPRASAGGRLGRRRSRHGKSGGEPQQCSSKPRFASAFGLVSGARQAAAHVGLESDGLSRVAVRPRR